VLWLAVHIAWLIGFRNRLVVLIDWAWSYFTYQRGARVVDELFPPELEPRPPAETARRAP
jgi:NADH dehydrogenase